MVEKRGRAFLSNDCAVDVGLVLLMGGDNDINEAVDEQLDEIWLLIDRCLISDF